MLRKVYFCEAFLKENYENTPKIKDKKQLKRKRIPQSFSNKKIVSLEELESEEKRLKTKFPESYKLFVLKNGLISYGDARQIFFPLKTLSQALKDEFGLDDNAINNYYEDKEFSTDLISAQVVDVLLIKKAWQNI